MECKTGCSKVQLRGFFGHWGLSWVVSHRLPESTWDVVCSLGPTVGKWKLEVPW